MSLLLGSTIRISIVLLVGLACVAVLRNRSSAMRHWILAVTMLSALAMPMLELVVPTWGIGFVGAPSQPIVARTMHGAQVTQGVRTSATSWIDAGSAAPSTRRAAVRVADFAGFVWLAGASASFFVLLAGIARLTWLASRGRRLSRGRWRQIAEEICRDYGVRDVLLLQSDHPSLLVTWGLTRPKILLPRGAHHWTTARIRIVLRHELAHIRRRDWLVQITGELVRCAWWFNPLVWIACARLRQESEQACDDEVLICGVEASAYATELLALARALRPAPARYSPALAIARSSGLERRIRAMLDARVTRNRGTRRVRFGTAAMLIAFGVGVAAAQTGQVSLSGTVFDSTGAPVSGATVLLTSVRTHAKYEVESNAAGRFEFVPLPSDDYVLEGRFPGFARLEERIALIGSSVRRDLTLPLGTVQETVNVKGARNTLQPTAQPAALTTGDRDAFQRELAGCTSQAAGGRVRPPRKIKHVSPVYPAHLQDLGIAGKVVLRGTVGTDGTFRDLQVVSSAYPDLDSAALDAVRQWQFDGVLLNCTPVEFGITVSVDFSLQ
jgi:TonB family protein